MDDVLSQAIQWRRSGRGVAVATVLTTWGSSPRPAGSQLVVNDESDFLGSVSGGCVEASVIEASVDVIRSGEPRFLSFGVTNEAAWELGLACGGRVEIYLERLD
jgi:xanthine/CO dehydrogenase XdhC/CoxF family maturation factor